jgi:Tfp pilus tip-associated adhesin PilY1
MASKSSQRKKTSAAVKQPAQSTSPVRWVAVGILLVVVVFGAYRVMTAAGQRGAAASTASAGGVSAVAAPSASGAKITGPEVSGTAVVASGVQKLSVDVTTGVYNPNVIHLKAGVPAEITFSQGPGCTSRVHSQDLGFDEDLSAGPKTVKLAALQPGTYGFSCGMNMVFGKVVVE